MARPRGPHRARGRLAANGQDAPRHWRHRPPKGPVIVTDPSSASPTPSSPPTKRSPIVWIVVAVVVALVLFVGGPFLYINVIKEDAPPPLALPTATTTTTAGADGASSTTAGSGSGATEGVDGSWAVAEGTTVGYRVEEVLFGQST